MAISYSWKITALKKAPSLDGLSDVITHVNFVYTGSKGSGNNKIEAEFNGACPIGSPDSENFIALADLKESDVIAWAQANHPVEHMQEVIGKSISDQETPTNVEVESLPWVEEEEEESSEE
jgi:GTP cyclohydrolase FolE2